MGTDWDRVLRWEAAGGIWQVGARTATSATVELLRCDGGETVDRVVLRTPAEMQALVDRLTWT